MPPELSVILPARNEEWLARTVEDVLAHSERDTECIVLCDGAWSASIPVNPRVQLLYVPTSIGQRAATNIGVKLSTAKYVMKLDAHCSMSQGFDRVLIEAAEQLGQNVTQIPAQRHLHIYDQLCKHCKHRADQAPHWNGKCPKCGSKDIDRVVLWEVRKRPTTTAWRMDSTLHFQYDSEQQKRQTGDICDTFSSLGACFFVERDQYWKLGGLDEGHGSWGQMGTEWGLKSWLSGGRQVSNKGCYFSHFFRVGGIGFPHPVTNADQEKARQYSRDLWFNNKWEGQIYPLAWVIEKFRPITGWHDAAGADALKRVNKAAKAFSALKPRAPVGRSLANTAQASARAGDDGLGMPLRATVALGVAIADTAPQVLGKTDQFEMCGVAAGSVATEVVELRNVTTSTERQVADEPRVHEAVSCVDRALDSDAAVAVALPGACPVPAAGRLVEGDVPEEACDVVAVEAGDCEIVRGSHAPASFAVVGSGPSVRSERIVGPSILHRTFPRGIVYYSDNQAPIEILEAARLSIERAGLPIVAVTLKPIDWPAALNIVWPGERGIPSMFRQILLGLQVLNADVAYFAEQDVIYHDSHWAFTPPRDDTYYYGNHFWKVNAETGHAVTYEAKQTSGLCAKRRLLLNHYRRRMEIVERDGFSRKQGFEPGSHSRDERIDDFKSDVWRAPFPNVDVRYGGNLTESRWSQSQFRDQRNCRGWQEAGEIPGWGVTSGRFTEWLAETTTRLSTQRMWVGGAPECHHVWGNDGVCCEIRWAGLRPDGAPGHGCGAKLSDDRHRELEVKLAP